MYNPVEVCWFDSDMAGAPAMGRAAGALITVLDDCLINGFNSQTLTSLVVSGGVATATKTSHGFWDHTVVLISGATPTDLNGKKRITRVDANSFTFEAVGIANGTATGTILAKMAPAGWTKTSLGTNDAYYTKPHAASTPWALQVTDTYTDYVVLAGRHKTTGTTFAYSGGNYLYKSTSIGTRYWSVYADGRSIYINVNNYNNTAANYRLAGFTDLVSFNADSTNDCLLVSPYNSSGNTVIHQVDGQSATGSILPNSVPAYRMAIRHYSMAFSGYGTTLIDGSSASDGCFQCAPIEVWDTMSGNIALNPRGIMAGCFSSMHDYDCVSHGTILTNPQWVRAPQLRDHRIRVIKATGNGMLVMDITGPWYPTDRYYGSYRIRGTAKKLGAAGRFPLALIVKDSGQIIRKTLSAADGSYAFNNIDYLYQGYIVIEFDGEITDPLNAAIADLVTPEAMP